jgi:hypothetical protein
MQAVVAPDCEQPDWNQPTWIYEGKSCATILLEFLENTTPVDRGDAFSMVHLDFANAFNKSPSSGASKEDASAQTFWRYPTMGVELVDKPAPEISPQREVLHVGGVLSGVLQGSMHPPLRVCPPDMVTMDRGRYGVPRKGTK